MSTQEEINAGQQKVNGNLCRVDWRLIKALEAVVDILGKIPEANCTSLASLKAMIKEADGISAGVAGDDPPGCKPRERSS